MSDARQEVRDVPEAGGTPLAGRAVVITGASSGIGRGTTRTLAGACARVGLAARRVERIEGLKEEMGQSGWEALALPTDVTDYTQAEAMVSRAEEAFGGVDVLVNVAGVMLPAPIAEADPADWRRMVEVNLMGVLHATRAALPGILERGNGHIVNVSSTSGRVASPLFSATRRPSTASAPSPRSCARRCAPTASASRYSSPGRPSRSLDPTSTPRS
jgi:NADP-dependent 3-hydroxy acid dehydrogenase YdfG